MIIKNIYKILFHIPKIFFHKTYLKIITLKLIRISIYIYIYIIIQVLIYCKHSPQTKGKSNHFE